MTILICFLCSLSITLLLHVRWLNKRVSFLESHMLEVNNSYKACIEELRITERHLLGLYNGLSSGDSDLVLRTLENVRKDRSESLAN